MDAAEALRWVAEKFDAQAEELREDWVAELVRAGTRARIKALSDAATMCRTAALRVERGESLD